MEKDDLFTLYRAYLCGRLKTVYHIKMQTETPTQQKHNRQVARWLIAGVIMIMIQVLIGGITRLTESGLSITEWKPITGALPPLNDADWMTEFDKYKTTDQFKYVHQNFSLSEFKYIFFWEWFHRLWARTMGMVFLVGFIYFLVTKKFSRKMVMPMAILFLLGVMQGAIGWLMVKSGLVPEKYFVGHVELTTHFIAALILLSYTLWFAFSLLPSMKEKLISAQIKSLQIVLGIVFFFQLMYGGFMAGLKAAITAPTWPDINGKFMPGHNEVEGIAIVNDPLWVHFIHRGLAYIFLILAIAYYLKTRKLTYNGSFALFRYLFLFFVLAQVVLGIGSLLNATNHHFIWMAASHQFIAMMVVICFVANIFLVRKQAIN